MMREFDIPFNSRGGPRYGGAIEMITCDLFELSLEIEQTPNGPELVYKFWSDLPAGTLAGVSVTRTYRDMDGVECLWTLFDDEVQLTKGVMGDYSGGAGRVNIAQGDREGSEEFEDMLGDLSYGISTPVGDEITVNVSVGGRQRLRVFGRNNSNLIGQMVAEEGGIMVAEVRGVVILPLDPGLQPLQ